MSEGRGGVCKKLHAAFSESYTFDVLSGTERVEDGSDLVLKEGN